MFQTKIQSRFGFLLAALVGLAAVSILIFGWGYGLQTMVRPGPEENTTVPCTALCIALLALASLPVEAPKARSFQTGAVIAALAVLAFVGLPAFLTRVEPNGWLFFPPSDGDGLAVATQLGIIMASLAPMIRLRLIRYMPGVAVQLTFLGFVYFLSAAALIVLDATFFNDVPMMRYLSLNTAILFVLLFAAQLLTQLHLDRRLGADDEAWD